MAGKNHRIAATIGILLAASILSSAVASQNQESLSYFTCLFGNGLGQYQVQSFEIHRSGTVTLNAISRWVRGNPQNVAVAGNQVFVSNAAARTVAQFLVSNSSIASLVSENVPYSPWFLVPFRRYIFSSSLLGSTIYRIEFRLGKPCAVKKFDIHNMAISGMRLVYLKSGPQLFLTSAIGDDHILLPLRSLARKAYRSSYSRPVNKGRMLWLVSSITNRKVLLSGISLQTGNQIQSRSLRAANVKGAKIICGGRIVYTISTNGALNVYHVTNDGGYRLVQSLPSKILRGCDTMTISGNYMMVAQGGFHQIEIYAIAPHGKLVFIGKKSTGANRYLIAITSPLHLFGNSCTKHGKRIRRIHNF
ncbi:hypothetical protein HF669_01525 [Acidithiobacillus thiooxidans]|jgi:hypothetical protein|uniref:Uncharacterized protein n=1 Tax=Acidithiobacillus montserratensis TaxID=2729135 RepID=A0ACD5HDD7_9PROT|nr:MULTISPECIES: hypothetical protein [Acidithiobacillus]MBU2748847.1 hypothetical protein [Acidithiobacillus montserratensis]MBU2792608.1 hypothetical protein [Acidithiobacillus thiooxidans]MBU2810086.1 hypothetical protein [Acidithiobacillus thiooxidans]MBU2836679.1 hypothetical protein [Acidithiobacillus thiooxidans]